MKCVTCLSCGLLGLFGRFAVRDALLGLFGAFPGRRLVLENQIRVKDVHATRERVVDTANELVSTEFEAAEGGGEVLCGGFEVAELVAELEVLVHDDVEESDGCAGVFDGLGGVSVGWKGDNW